MCCSDDGKDKPRADLVPASERSCTDILFFLLFLASFGGVVYVYQDSLDKGGDARRLVKPSNFEGTLCGSTGTGGRPRAAWPDPIGAPLFRTCVASCDETNDSTRFVYATESVDFLGLYCLPVPGEVFQVIADSSSAAENFTSGTVGTPSVFSDAKESVARAFADLEVTYKIILVSPFIALAISFIWLFFIRLAASFIIWTSVILTAAGAGFLGYTMLEQAEEYEGDEELDDNRAKYARITGYVFIGLAVLFLLVVFALRTRIRIAVAVIKEASRAVVDMPCVMCVPVMPIALGLLYVAAWIYVALTIFSVGDFRQEEVPDTIVGRGVKGDLVETINPDFNFTAYVPDENANYTIFVVDENQRYSFAYHFFHLLYFTAFCVYLAYAVIAGAVAEWYFTPYTMDGSKPRGSGEDELANHAVLNSCARTVRFHLGTVSVGALIIAIVRFIRALLVYLQEKLKPADGSEPNMVFKAIFCCLHCCFWLLECCCDKINKNAFIWMAIWGDNFGTSACASFALVWRNLLRVAVLEMVGDYLMFLGKVMIAFATAGGVSFYMTKNDSINQEISSVMVPTIAVFVLAYMVASLFMVVFETTVDTTFLCFLVDEENNSPNLCAAKELAQIVDKFQAENKAEASKRLNRRSPSQYPGGEPPRGMSKPKVSSSADGIELGGGN